MQLDVWTCNCRVYFMALIFQNIYDTQMRNGVKGSKAAVEVMEYVGVKDRADSLKAMVDAETKAASSIDDAKQQKEISDGERDATDKTDTEQSGLSKDATNIGCRNNIHVAEGLSKDQCAYYNALVYRTVRSLVVLTTEQTTALATKQVVEQLAALKIKPQPGTYFGIRYNVPESGESVTAPHRRSPPLREDRLQVFVSGVMQARGDEHRINPRDIIMLSDGGKPGPQICCIGLLLRCMLLLWQ